MVNDTRPEAWYNIFDYVNLYTNQDASLIEHISKLTKLKAVDVAYVVIFLNGGGFIDQPYAKDVIGIIDSQINLDPRSVDSRNNVLRRIKDGFDTWQTSYMNEATNEYHNYKGIPDIINKLDRLTPIQGVDETVVISREMTYPFTAKESAIQMFDRAVVSIDIPFICISNAGRVFYKVFHSDYINLSYEYYVALTDRLKGSPPEDTISFILWKGDDKADPENPTRESLSPCIIADRKVIINYDIKGGMKYNVQEKVGRTFGITLQEPIVGNANISFRINNLIVNSNLFQLTLETDPVMHSLLIMDEQTVPGSSKRGHVYQFLNMGTVLPQPRQTPKLGIKPDLTGTIFGIQNVHDSRITYYRDLAIKIATYYQQESKANFRDFKYLPWIATPTVSSKSAKASNLDKSTSVLNMLKRAAPHIFINTYARRCQGDTQPLPISKEDIPKYLNATNPVTGKKYQVMPFPQDKPEVNLVCTGSSPYPGITTNKLDNKDSYPYIPCCYDASSLDESTGRYIPRRDKNKSTGKNILTTNKIIQFGRLATLPYRINNLLTSINPNFNYYRAGTVYGMESILHAVLYAAVEPYRSAILSDDFSTVNIFINKFRQSLINHCIPEVAKQELYDYSNIQIKELLNNKDRYMDGTLVYRLLEEALPYGDGFGVNIYMFTGSLTRNLKTGLQGDILMPRYKMFHTRNLRPNRPVIMLYRNWGSESDNIEEPNYEVIVALDAEGDSPQISLFDGKLGQDFNSKLYQVLLQTHEIQLTNVTGSHTGSTTNPFGVLDYEEEFRKLGCTIQAQNIDGYGKCRALSLTKQGVKFAALIAPSQPINVVGFEKIVSIPSSSVIQLLGVPQSRTEGGLWYKIRTYSNAFYVPVSDKQITKIDTTQTNLMGLISTLYSTGGDKTTNRMVKLSKISVGILQIMEWLYNIVDSGFRSSEVFVQSSMDSTMEVLKSHMIVRNNSALDTLSTYNIDKVPYNLRIVNDIETALQYLKTLMPSAVSNDNKFIVISGDMEASINYFLERYARYSTIAQRNSFGYIYERYTSVDDFVPRANNIIFSDSEDLYAWIKTITNVESKIEINEDIITWNSLDDEPYVYYSPEFGKFLIQNVKDHSIASCVYVHDQWIKKQINEGMVSKSDYPILDRQIVIYHLGANRRLKLVETVNADKGSKNNKVSVIEYTKGNYAVLLEFN